MALDASTHMAWRRAAWNASQACCLSCDIPSHSVHMLNAFTALFETPKLLKTMRMMSQAVEAEYNGPPLPHLTESLEDTFEGRRKACESAMPNAIYRDLHEMDEKLQAAICVRP